jgi:glutathione S-transferase
MLTVYHAPMSRSVRIRWLLEELGLPYEVATRPLAELKRPDYLAIHPMGKVPTLHDDGAGRDVKIFESGAIVQYLLETYGKGRLEPAIGTPERPYFLQWLHFSEATLTPPLGEIAQHTVIRPEAERIAAVVPDARRRAKAAISLVENALAGSTWLLSEFSAADVMLGYSLALASFMKLIDDDTPNARAYLDRCRARPAFKAATA